MPGKRTLAGRFLLFSLVINSLLLIVLGASLTMLSGNVMQNEVTASCERMLLQTKRLIDTYFSDARTRLVRLASLSDVIVCMNMENPRPARTLAHEREMDRLLTGVDLFTPIQDVLILGKNGYVYNLNNRQNLKSDYDFTKEDWFVKASTVENGVTIKMISPHDQKYYNVRQAPSAAASQTISLAMAVHNADRETIGAIVCCFDLSHLTELFRNANHDPSARLMLLDENGVICVQSSGDGIGRQLRLNDEGFRKLYARGSASFEGTIDEERMLICSDSLSFSNWKLAIAIPINSILAHSSPLRMMLVPALLIGLLLNLIIAVYHSRSVQKPVAALLDSLSSVDVSEIKPIEVRREYQELERISDKFNDLLDHIDQLVLRDYRTRLELSRFEMAALQAQINPHFLFNTLQLLQTEILYGNTEKSNRIIITLSQMMRYCMTNGEAVVPVAQEMEYLEKYLMLFDSKFEGKLTTQIEMDPRAAHLYMPKLLVQPVVENAIRHVADRAEAGCHISVDVQLQEDTLLISVEDDGDGIDQQRLEQIRSGLERSIDWMKSSIGLANVHQRIRTIYGPAYGLSIDSGPDGTVVLLRLPCREMPEQDGQISAHGRGREEKA